MPALYADSDVVAAPAPLRENGHQPLRRRPYGPLWMPHPRRINSMAGTSTPYPPADRGGGLVSPVTAAGGEAQQHQEARVPRAPPAHDQRALTGNSPIP